MKKEKRTIDRLQPKTKKKEQQFKQTSLLSSAIVYCDASMRLLLQNKFRIRMKIKITMTFGKLNDEKTKWFKFTDGLCLFFNSIGFL